jgi:hypothetical protein
MIQTFARKFFISQRHEEVFQEQSPEIFNRKFLTALASGFAAAGFASAFARAAAARAFSAPALTSASTRVRLAACAAAATISGLRLLLLGHHKSSLPFSTLPQRPAFGRFGLFFSSAAFDLDASSSPAVPMFNSGCACCACATSERLLNLFGSP